MVKEYTVDDVFDIIGHVGFMQMAYTIEFGMLGIFLAQHMILNMFEGLAPNYLCYLKNDTGLSHPPLINECPDNDPSMCNLNYTSDYRSFASEWDLVCRDKYWVALVQSAWMAGVMSGALFLGGMPDRFGRLKALHFSLIFTILLEGTSSIANSYFTFTSLRFLGGVSCSIVILSSFVLLQELVGRSKRAIVAVLGSLFFSAGIGILASIAALVSDWRTLSLLTSLMGLVLLLLPWFIPESPRWLVSQGNFVGGKKVMQILIDGNGMSEKLVPEEWELVAASGPKAKSSMTKATLMDIMRHSYLVMIMLIQIFSWFVNGMVYYALTLASSTVKGNVYIVTTFNGLVEIPSQFAALFLMDRYGRRPSVIFFMVIGGISCMLIPALGAAYPYSSSVLAICGKLTISASFSIIYIHSGEVFPTSVRNGALGIVSVASRVGGIASPLVLMLNDVYPNLHFFVLGLVTFAAGVLSSRLPETLNQAMPDTYEDVIALGKASNQTSTRIEDYKQLLEEDLFDDSDDIVEYDCCASSENLKEHDHQL